MNLMSRLEENNLKKKLLHNGFWMYLFAFFIAPSGYILKMLIAREVSVEDIWVFYSVLGFVTILSAYNDLGLTESLQYFLPKYLLKKEIKQATALIWFTWIIQFCSGFLFFCCLYFLAPWLAENYFSSSLALPVLRVFSLYFLIINLYQVLASLFYATQQVKRVQFIEFVRMRSIVIFTLLAIFVFDVFSMLNYTWYWLLWVLFGVVVACIGILKIYPRVISTSVSWLYLHLRPKEWLQYGLWVMLWQSASTLYWQVNQQLVLLFLWAWAAGIRAYYLTFFSIIHVITWPLISYLFPLLNELHEKWDQNKIHELYKYLFWWLLLFWIIWWVVAYYFTPRVAVLLFGEQFRYAGELFILFSPYIRIIPLTGIAFADIASRGWVKQRVFALLFWLIVLCISSSLWIYYYGLIWSVYGHIIGTIGLLCSIFFIYRKHIHNFCCK